MRAPTSGTAPKPTVDMPDEHSCAWDIGVPSFFLPVFQQEKFRVLFCGDKAGLIAAEDMLQFYVGRAVEHSGLVPSQGVALECAVRCRRAAVVVVAHVQHAPCAGRHIFGILVIDVVEVGQTHHVREFVDERAYAVGFGAVPLVGARIVVEHHAVGLAAEKRMGRLCSRHRDAYMAYRL